MTTVEKARKAFSRRDWTKAYDLFSTARKNSPLETGDEESLAVVAYLIGKDLEGADAWVRAHNRYSDQDDIRGAIRSAFWTAFVFFNRNEVTRGGAWITRAHQLLNKAEGECVERGYLLLPKALEYIDSGDPAGACHVLEEVLAIADRCVDQNLTALAQHAYGRALIRAGHTRKGVDMLDAAMVAAETGGVSPIVAGDVYCSVISGCLEIFDLRRAREWTAALTHWCDSQPDLVAFNGQCQVRRAEILRFHGAWPEALETAEKACQRCLDGPDQAAIGAAYYQRAEQYRLLGDFSRAEEDYRLASRHGRNPQPGISLLRLAQDQVGAAAAAIESARTSLKEQRLQIRLLPAYVEIMLSAGDLDKASHAADELAKISSEIGAQFLKAIAAQAEGAVCIGRGDNRSALSILRHAWVIWQDLEAVYEAARVRVLIGTACKNLGDEDTAGMEFDAACWVFHQLRASPDMKKVAGLANRDSTHDNHGLTSREMEVLRLVATGKTNKAISEELFISERTVDRHVSNIFLKLNVDSRTAAAAYAYRHNLL